RRGLEPGSAFPEYAHVLRQPFELRKSVVIWRRCVLNPATEARGLYEDQGGPGCEAAAPVEHRARGTRRRASKRGGEKFGGLGRRPHSLHQTDHGRVLASPEVLPAG